MSRRIYREHVRIVDGGDIKPWRAVLGRRALGSLAAVQNVGFGERPRQVRNVETCARLTHL
jgi:hypothetical protein